MIQESKFLGGDMEHTHLVKGLDFALLQKVRSEIINRYIIDWYLLHKMQSLLDKIQSLLQKNGMFTS